MNIEFIENSSRWDSYVTSHPDATLYHSWAWGQAVKQTYGHKPYYLLAIEGQSVVGVLPLVSMKSRLFGRFLVSMPFSSYGGVLASHPEASRRLALRAADLGCEIGARHVELRQAAPGNLNWSESTAKVTMTVPLPCSTEELWKKLTTGIRNKVRNFQRNKITIEWRQGEAINEFYALFSQNMRDLGTPVYPKCWFESLCRHFGDQIRIMVLRDAGGAVAAGFVTLFRDVAELPWSASLRDSRKKYSAVGMYWALLQWALENGYRRVDFGRCTRGSGTYEFKRHWPCEEKPLHWYYWLSKGTKLPELRPENPRYSWATRIWRRLPVPVANWLGPRIVRAIP